MGEFGVYPTRIRREGSRLGVVVDLEKSRPFVSSRPSFSELQAADVFVFDRSTPTCFITSMSVRRSAAISAKQRSTSPAAAKTGLN